MTAKTKCKECSKPFSMGENSIGCEGFCSGFYHVECAKFTFDELVCYRKLQNVWYICKECRIVMDEVKSSRSTPDTKKEMVAQPPDTCTKLDRFDLEISALKEQITAIHQTLVDVSSSRSSKASVNTSVPLSQSSMPSASTLRCGAKCVDNPLLSSTPSQENANLTRTPFDVSCEYSCCSKLFTGSRGEHSFPEARRKVWVFFTGVANHVTCNGMSEMVTKCLKLDDPPEVTRLISRWRYVGDSHPVSFKVGVDWKYKDKALQETTWPAGLLFREFIPVKHRYWEP